ncbi:hypothetical protein [Escherichia coli]|uniref:hypothetical protein n=1 Tax=Escherichia coli TaxID=562 RepID=UPI001F3E0684|nr:hypothetical protein [Escherichia coli]
MSKLELVLDIYPSLSLILRYIYCLVFQGASSVENHHAVRQAKRKANTTYMKAYRKAWKEHRDRYQQDMEKLESENMELRRKLGEAKRDIDAYKRLFNGESHA